MADKLKGGSTVGGYVIITTGNSKNLDVNFKKIRVNGQEVVPVYVYNVSGQRLN
jgi:hypothetical protein